MTEEGKKGHRERLRKSFLGCEESSQTDESLLELLLTYAIPQKDVQPLAKALIARFGSLREVLSASFDDLCIMEGIKDYSALLIKLVDCILTLHTTGRGSIYLIKRNDNGQLTFPDEMISSRSHFAEPDSHLIEKKVSEAKFLPKPESKLFSISALDEAAKLLPKAPDTEDLEQIKAFLRENLHFNSVRTRRDYAAYIVKRLFPMGFADKAFRKFLVKYEGNQSVRDICFYRFAKSEPLTIDVVLDLLLPSVGAGRIGRDSIKSFLMDRFGPENKNIKNCMTDLIKVLIVSGIAYADKGNLRFSYREVEIPSFAFILHSEFPEPGIYDIQKLDDNTSMKAMLWNPDRILPALYELRNKGLINKISEIDSVRQFTTKFTLDQAIERLTIEGMQI